MLNIYNKLPSIGLQIRTRMDFENDLRYRKVYKEWHQGSTKQVNNDDPMVAFIKGIDNNYVDLGEFIRLGLSKAEDHVGGLRFGDDHTYPRYRKSSYLHPSVQELIVLNMEEPSPLLKLEDIGSLSPVHFTYHPYSNLEYPMLNGSLSEPEYHGHALIVINVGELLITWFKYKTIMMYRGTTPNVNRFVFQHALPSIDSFMEISLMNLYLGQIRDRRDTFQYRHFSTDFPRYTQYSKMGSLGEGMEKLDDFYSQAPFGEQLFNPFNMSRLLPQSQQEVPYMVSLIPIIEEGYSRMPMSLVKKSKPFIIQTYREYERLGKNKFYHNLSPSLGVRSDIALSVDLLLSTLKSLMKYNRVR